MKNKKAFTLVEVLLVIVIIAILAAIVIVAINPGRQLSQANNTQRRSDIKSILDAVSEYSIDNRGSFPAAITSTLTTIGNGTGQIDICADLVPRYIAEMPYDPTATGAGYTDCTEDYDTGYQIVKDATTSRITVSAGSAELTETIAVTR